MTRMVGRVADGMITHPTNTPPEYIRAVCLPRLQEGLDRAGRQVQSLRLILGPLVATGVDEGAVAAQWEQQRRLLGFLYSTPAYWPSLELFGWQERGAQLQALTREGRWQDLSSIVTDEMLEVFVPRGAYEDIADTLRNRYSGLADSITFPMPADPAEDAHAARAIARLRGA